VIFDIDDTLVRYHTQTPNSEVVKFYHQVANLGYHIVILTARLQFLESITIDQLEYFGLNDYDKIIFRRMQESDYGKYKLVQRKKLAKIYDIVANVGDMDHDFFGGYNGMIIQV
jgi:predicted secreted acid phosphatase